MCVTLLKISYPKRTLSKFLNLRKNCQTSLTSQYLSYFDRIRENGKDDVMSIENEPGATGTAAYQTSQEGVNSTSAAAPVTEGSASAEGLQTGRPARSSCDRSDSLESLGSNYSGKQDIPYLASLNFKNSQK